MNIGNFYGPFIEPGATHINPVSNNEELKKHASKEYEHYDIPLTLGILIADYEQDLAKQYILNYLNIFDKKSGKYIDFYIPGYSHSSNCDSYELPLSNLKGNKYHFSRSDFNKFIMILKNAYNVKYNYNPMLILIEYTKNDFNNSKKIILELDSKLFDIKKTGELLEQIFEVSHTDVSIEKFRHALEKSYFKSTWLNSALKILRTPLIEEIITNTNNVRKFRLK